MNVMPLSWKAKAKKGHTAHFSHHLGEGNGGKGSSGGGSGGGHGPVPVPKQKCREMPGQSSAQALHAQVQPSKAGPLSPKITCLSHALSSW